MVRKLSTLFESIGARPQEGAGRLAVEASVFGVTSLFGGDVGETDVEVLSDEAFVFKSPPEMLGIGPLWVAGLDDARQLKSAVRDAHARLKARLEDDQKKLEGLGMKPKLQPPEPLAAAELVLGGHVALITLDATGALLVVEVSGRRVPQKSQQLGLALSDATAESVRGAAAELVQKMQRAGLLTGRGMFDAATLRGPFAAPGVPTGESPADAAPATHGPSANAPERDGSAKDRLAKDGLAKDGLAKDGLAKDDDKDLPSVAAALSGATVVAAVADENSGLKSDVRRVPRPKRRSSEDQRSGHGAAARSSSGAALRSSTGDAIRSTSDAPLSSMLEGDESLLPSPAVDVATTRPSSAAGDAPPPSTPTIARDANPFGATSGDTGVNVGVSLSDAALPSEVDVRSQASGFDAGQETGIGDALLSVPENSEEELLHALEEFSSEESADGSLSDTGTEVHTTKPPANPTAESPVQLAVTAVPGLDVLDDDDGGPSAETGEIDAFDDAGEHTAIATSYPSPEVTGAAAKAVSVAMAAEAPEAVSPDKDTDKVKPLARPNPTAASLDAAWKAAETAARSVGKSVATTSDVPINFDVDASTGEHPRTFSAEQTFNALQGVVGEGLSTGKTGAFILDAEAFAYLRGEAASNEISGLESEIATLEARLADARARLVALKAGQLQAQQESESTAPKGRLAEKKKKLLEERGRAPGDANLDLPSLASEIEPPSNTGPAANEDEASHDEGVALADVARAIEREGGFGERADATQMVVAAYSHLDPADDVDGVFDSRQEEPAAVDINMNSLEDEASPSDEAEQFEVDSDGETRVADVRSLSAAQTGPVGIVVADARALDRLTRHLEEQYENIVALSGLPPQDAIGTIAPYRALVLVRPKADDETFARLRVLVSHRRRPQVLCLSTDARFDDAEGIDLRLELAKKAGEVAQQVVDGLKQLGVSAGARAK
jgi:hypothetical protein